MDQELDVPCRGNGDEACAEMIHYKREPLKGMWRGLVIYLTCKKGHTNAYELPLQPAAATRAPRRAVQKTTRKSAPARSPAPRRTSRHER